MESLLTTLLPQIADPTVRSERLGARGAESREGSAPLEVGGFAQLLAAAEQGAEPTAALVEGVAVTAGVEAGAAAATLPLPLPLPLLRRLPASARADGSTDAVRMEAIDQGEGRLPDVVTRRAMVAQGDPLAERSTLVRAVQTDSRDAVPATEPPTALMQWMLQMVQPIAPETLPVAPEAVAQAAQATPDAQGGAALLQVGWSAGLGLAVDRAGVGADARSGQIGGKGMRGVLELTGAATAIGADTASAAGVAPRRFQLAEVTATASPAALAEPRPATAAAATVAERTPVAAAVLRAGSAGPSAGAATGADGLAQIQAQALIAAASPAATAAVTPAGTPVVAPGQTWIQTPVTQPGFSDEVVVELVRRVGQAEQGPQSLTLHLNPVEMGPVSVSIELQGRDARIEFGASEALTRQHLEAALPGLAQALLEEGVSLAHGGVHEASRESLAAGAAGQSSSGGAGEGRPRGADGLFDGRSGQGDRAPHRESQTVVLDGRAAAAGGAAAVVGALGSVPGRAGRLDLFA